MLYPVKTVKCKNCGADVNVNASYPITSVDNCKKCGLYDRRKMT